MIMSLPRTIPSPYNIKFNKLLLCWVSDLFALFFVSGGQLLLFTAFIFPVQLLYCFRGWPYFAQILVLDAFTIHEFKECANSLPERLGGSWTTTSHVSWNVTWCNSIRKKSNAYIGRQIFLKKYLFSNFIYIFNHSFIMGPNQEVINSHLDRLSPSGYGHSVIILKVANW